ncbi:MAG: hypothetical protein RJA03_395 [Pseudomonadota bacterium]
MFIKDLIRTIPDYPKPGIMFRDITTLIKDPKGFNYVISEFSRRYSDMKIDKVVGIESRGFIIGAPVANSLGVGFVPVRKRGKLPAKTHSCEYQLEYGFDHIEVHVDAISSKERILLIDDLIATGGTAEAACSLINQCGGEIVECAFVIDLPELGGKKRLESKCLSVFTIVEFEGH